jgi:hypothetical protein
MIVRMFQGKAVYLSIIVPTIFYLTWKIPTAEYAVAETAIRAISKYGRLLAPGAIAGIISRFERVPN